VTSSTDLAVEAYAVALAELPGMTITRLRKFVDTVGCEEAWRRVLAGTATGDPDLRRRWQQSARRVDVAGRGRAYREAGVSVHILGEQGYPEALATDHQAPAVLFATGDLGSLERPRVGIVGARRCTHYGRDVARDFGRGLAEAGVVVVSGLALGIDGAAHEGALAAGAAPPVAVVGSGLDVIYPKRHRSLWQRVAEAGCVLSESPLGAQPDAWRFPARNRIIAAISQVLLVVEAHGASGSRHTVDSALARDVTVLAVPGPIRSAASAGVNRLLQEGCAPACDVDDVLMALQLQGAGRGRDRAADRRAVPSGIEAAVLAAVDWVPTSVETILQRTRLPPLHASMALSHLELAGWVRPNAGWWERIAGS